MRKIEFLIKLGQEGRENIYKNQNKKGV